MSACIREGFFVFVFRNVYALQNVFVFIVFSNPKFSFTDVEHPRSLQVQLRPERSRRLGVLHPFLPQPPERPRRVVRMGQDGEGLVDHRAGPPVRPVGTQRIRQHRDHVPRRFPVRVRRQRRSCHALGPPQSMLCSSTFVQTPPPPPSPQGEHLYSLDGSEVIHELSFSPNRYDNHFSFHNTTTHHHPLGTGCALPPEPPSRSGTSRASRLLLSLCLSFLRWARRR